METAVIYARYSSDHQREESIEGQVRECKDYAERKGLSIVNIYIDRAMSARSDARPEFQKMIADSERKLFDYVIVYQLDRFSRNRYDSAKYKYRLKQNGVKVLSAKENLSDEPASIILESVLEGLSEYYSAELAQKITRGMTENALKGRWASGRVPFGYRTDENKKLIIDEKEAPYVRKIFEMLAEGQPIASVIKYLNDAGIRTKYGNAFNRSSFHRMVQNPVYIGTFRWKDVSLENAVPAIIDEQLFYACQSRAKRSKLAPARQHGTEYLLTTKLTCGNCGSAMIGMSGTSKSGAVHNYYTCLNHRRKASNCFMTALKRELLEKSICDHITGILSNSENVELIAEQAAAISQEASHSPVLEALAAQQQDIQKKLNNCLRAVENGLYSESLSERIKQYENDLQKVKAEYAREKILTAPLAIDKKVIIFFLSRILKNNEDKRFIIATFLRNATVKKESDGDFTVTVTLNFAKTDSLSNTDTFPVHDEGEGVRFIPLWWR